MSTRNFNRFLSLSVAFVDTRYVMRDNAAFFGNLITPVSGVPQIGSAGGM